MAMDTAQVHAKSRFFTDPTPEYCLKVSPAIHAVGSGCIRGPNHSPGI